MVDPRAYPTLMKDRVEQSVALGFTAEEIAAREKVPLQIVLDIMRVMDEAHRAPATPADKMDTRLTPPKKVVFLPVDRDRPEPHNIRSKGCAVCFRRRPNKPNAVCRHCNQLADQWEASLPPHELAELDAAMKRHPAGKKP